MSIDDCGPEIEDLYSTERLRMLAHQEALKRPDFDEFTTRVIAIVQLVESQQKSAITFAAVDQEVRRQLDDATRLLAKVVTGGNPTGVEWQRINELIRRHAQ